MDESVEEVINESQEIEADQAPTVDVDADADADADVDVDADVDADVDVGTDTVGEGEENPEVASEDQVALEGEAAVQPVETEEASIGIGTEILSDSGVGEIGTGLVAIETETETESESESDGDEVEVGDRDLVSESDSSALEDGSSEAVSSDTEIDSEPFEPYDAPRNEAELLLIQAQQAIADGEIPSAIRMSWDSINQRPENPAGWFILSRAYVKFNQNLNAESAALEAMRLNPKNKKIALNYLGILQRSRGSDRFHVELLNVYQRFSTDPDFVLALARSYARIKNDPQNSAALYRRFFDLSPEDPRAAEVRQEASFVE